jgi:hypothetical protein
MPKIPSKSEKFDKWDESDWLFAASLLVAAGMIGWMGVKIYQREQEEALERSLHDLSFTVHMEIEWALLDISYPDRAIAKSHQAEAKAIQKRLQELQIEYCSRSYTVPAQTLYLPVMIGKTTILMPRYRPAYTAHYYTSKTELPAVEADLQEVQNLRQRINDITGKPPKIKAEVPTLIYPQALDENASPSPW